MKCLIIAAGKGRRLQKKGQCKPLIPLFGVALIERTIESALKAGADDFYVVTGHHHERVDAFLKRLSNRLNIPIQTLFNEKWQDTDNGISVLRARDHLHKPFLLLMTDHLFDPGIARDLIRAAEAQGGLTLAVDSQLDNPLVDLDDVTRVFIEQECIVTIGKNLEYFNAYDTGVFLCTASIFDALTQTSLATGNTCLSNGVALLAAAGQAHTFDIAGRFWIDVDDPVAFWRAENALLTRFQKQPEDVPA